MKEFPGLLKGDHRFSRAKLLCLSVFFSTLLFSADPCCAQQETEFRPEVDTYVQISARTRFLMITGVQSDPGTGQLTGDFGPNFDFYLRPLLRIRLRSLDPAKTKLLTFRIGYRYLPALEGEGATENRPIAELTARYHLPWKILVSDRNRGDFRFISGKPYSWRYRNRLTLERDFTIRKYTFTPYVRGELYYDSRYDKIAKNSFIAGSIFPFIKRSELDLYYADERDSGTAPNRHIRAAGLRLNLYF